MAGLFFGIPTCVFARPCSPYEAIAGLLLFPAPSMLQGRKQELLEDNTEKQCGAVGESKPGHLVWEDLGSLPGCEPGQVT